MEVSSDSPENVEIDRPEKKRTENPKIVKNISNTFSLFITIRRTPFSLNNSNNLKLHLVYVRDCMHVAARTLRIQKQREAKEDNVKKGRSNYLNFFPRPQR